MDNLCLLIGDLYRLDNAVADHLEFSFQTFVGNREKPKTVVFQPHQTISGLRQPSCGLGVPSQAVQVDDVQLKVRCERGDIVERDCSCDSTFMLRIMDDVGTAIRTAFHWIPQDQFCYLIMDNAGGHGTDQAIETYTNILRERYKIKIIFQVPRSPYTNVLDLGAWCALQTRVEKVHYMRRCEVECLAKSVYEAWNADNNFDVVVGKVFNRLQNVLVLILEGNGSNHLVEKKRGKQFRNLDLPQVLGAEQNNNQQQVVDAGQHEDQVFYDLILDEDDGDDIGAGLI